MMTQVIWDEILELSAAQLWSLIKQLVREAKVQGMLNARAGVFCTMLEVLNLQRQIEALEHERRMVNRMIGEKNEN